MLHFPVFHLKRRERKDFREKMRYFFRLIRMGVYRSTQKKHRRQLQTSIEFSTQVLHNHGTLSENQIAAIIHRGV